MRRDFIPKRDPFTGVIINTDQVKTPVWQEDRDEKNREADRLARREKLLKKWPPQYINLGEVSEPPKED